MSRPKTEEQRKIDAAIGLRIAFLRSREKVDLRTFGQLLGVSAQAVHQWERGIDGITHYKLMRICEVCNVSIEWLAIGVGRPRHSYESRMSMLSNAEKQAMDAIFEAFASLKQEDE